MQAGRALCVVGEVDELSPLSLPQGQHPVCSPSCCDGFAKAEPAVPEHPLVQASCVLDDGPCYCAVQGRAGQCPGGAVAAVWRRGLPPSGKATRFLCAR